MLASRVLSNKREGKKRKMPRFQQQMLLAGGLDQGTVHYKEMRMTYTPSSPFKRVSGVLLLQVAPRGEKGNKYYSP